MAIAVGVYSQSFVITEAYRSAGIIAGLSVYEMPAVFGLDINPFNVVLRNHGVIYTSHIDMNSAILNRDRRQMHLELTEAGWEIARCGQAAQKQFFSAAFQGITRQELDDWYGILQRMWENMQAMQDNR